MDSHRSTTIPTSNSNKTIVNRSDHQSSRLFQSIENTASVVLDSSDPVEEHKISSAQFQRQTNVDTMQEQRQGSPVNTRSAAKDEQMKAGTAISASAPTTPPFDSQSYSGYRNSVSPQDNKQRPPEEGLNGSNVPGLAPSDAAPASIPGSRRTSGQGEGVNSNHANMNDLAGSFDRIAIGRGVKSGNGSPSLTQTPPPGTATTGQQSALQRAMSRSHLEAQSNGLISHGANGGEGGLTPMFNERFLFDDDELEADDSAFVKKYNLNADDHSFPVLIRRDSHPGLLSASSAALDLAPLSQTPPRFPRTSDDNAQNNVSEWPQFAGRNNETREPPRQTSGTPDRFDRFNGDRRGRSERNSPGLPSDQGTGGANPQKQARGLPVTGTPLSSSRPNGSSNDSQLTKGVAPSRFSSQTPHRLSQGFNEREVDEEQQRQSQPRPKDNVSNRNDSGFPSFAIDGFNNEGSNARPNNGGAPVNPPSRGFTPYGSGFDTRASSADLTRPPSAYFEAFASPVSSTPSGAKQGNNFGNSTASFGQISGDLNGAKGARKGELDVNTPLEELHGEIFALCKDQHGCRYLQKKLEEGVPSYRDIIFTETFSHFAELMTDPFGNYLCQKMLEYCTDEQRNLIVESVAQDLVGISLNMHGTRAVQKTIDFLSTSRQIHSIILALSLNVVTLIKDLNGNHVVQKCLNRLGAQNSQFIYEAVGKHCVIVGTHRHGCCVLQRCIDHASDKQRMQLVQEITYNALTLVQDPFGNYVVQYILDLNDSRFSDAVIRQFVGSVCLLSVQKFSSNVIEKCIRVSEVSIRKLLIEELLNRTRLEKLLRDSFANYVVQTSLDYADPVQRMQLVECIKPILPMIRNTPYGKRIQSKLQRDNIDMGSGPMPSNVSYSMLQAAHQQQLQAMAAIAQRQGGNGNANQGAEGYSTMGNGPYHGGGGAHHNNRGNYNRQNIQGSSPLPPPNMYASQGGVSSGRPYPSQQHQQQQQGGDVSSTSANLYNNGMTAYPRGPSNSQAGYPSQQGYGMQGGFGAAIPAHHGNAAYQNNYAPF